MSNVSKKKLPCPVCGFLTFSDYYGSYNVCSLCDWEDDGVQLANPCSGGGANKVSLAEAQKEAMVEYPLNIEIAKGFSRSKNWRPLTGIEIKKYKIEKSNNQWSNTAVFYEFEAYWMTSS